MKNDQRRKVMDKKITEEEFENRCMDVIESIASLDIRQDRKGAIKVAEYLLKEAIKKDSKYYIDIYTRVVKEFNIATDRDYYMLRKAIFESK